MLPDAPTSLEQLTLAAAAVFFAIQIVKAVLPLVLGKGETRRTIGELDLDTWRQAHREGVRDVLMANVVPIMQQQADILSELRTLAHSEVAEHLRLQIGVDALAEGQGKLRESQHRLNEKVQALVGRRGDDAG